MVIFYNVDVIKFFDDGDDKDKKWDVVVFFYFVWYLDLVDVLKNIFEKLKGRVKRVFVVEYVLCVMNKYVWLYVFVVFVMVVVGEER